MALVKYSLASQWYPAEPEKIDAALAEFAGKVRRPLKLKKPPVAGIVPHAGWSRSGPIAHEVWANLAERKPDLVVLFGGHVTPYQRSVIFADEGFETPVGPVMTHMEMVEGLSGAFRFRKHDASMWASDNTTEVHMPMIKRLFPEARIVVLHLPPRDIILDIVDLLMEFVRRNEARPVFVGSTDLTHYGPQFHFTPHGVGERAHRWARNENDAAFIQKLVELDPQGCLEEGLSNYNACCPGAAAAAVTSARLMGSEYGELLTQATSHEVTKDPDEPIDFIGYASVVF
jgi:MEMO1 family protein